MSEKSPYIVSTNWLSDRLGQTALSVVDASWYLPAMNRDGRVEYEQQHIPGAVYFDIDEVSDATSSLPHTLSSPEQFSKQMGELGISNTDTIIVYDGAGLFSAARAWWNFRVMGVANVFILDGGLPEWINAGHDVEAGLSNPTSVVFEAKFNSKALVPFDEMLKLVGSDQQQIADARPAGRFSGQEAEPRAGMRSGHMPGATNLPSGELSHDGRLHDLPKLREMIGAANIDENTTTITTCGSGVTAAIISLALESIGNKNHRLYDGSWTQWGGRDDTPIVK